MQFWVVLSKSSKKVTKAAFKDASWVSTLRTWNKSNPGEYEIIEINTIIDCLIIAMKFMLLLKWISVVYSS